MLDALRTNPALLKLDFYCRGARLDGSCYVEGRMLELQASLQGASDGVAVSLKNT